MPVNYQVVDDDQRSKRLTDVAADPALGEIFSGKTIEVEGIDSFSSWRKIAKFLGYRLHTRSKTGNITVVWAEKLITEIDPEDIPDATNTTEKVTA